MRFPLSFEVLDNGLTVIAHRDRKAPLVGVYIAYHVGSRDEPAGKSGLAHLFEHLMYCGTERFPGNTFRHLEKIGATSINAIAREDYTAYFATIPKDFLDQALAIEAERMQSNHFDAKAFERQREVVRNELLQREAEPYGSINRLIAEHAYPREHPYSHPADGTIAGLEQLSLQDAQNWYHTYYRPSNAVVVIAGDIASNDAIERVLRSFGRQQDGGGIPHPEISCAKPVRSRRIVIDEPTTSNRLYLVWNVPAFATPEYPGFDLLVEILSGGSESWLSKCLIKETRVATAVGTESRPREFGSQVVLWVDRQAGVSFKRLREAIERALAQLAGKPLPATVISHARARLFARWARDTERLCGPRSRAELIGTSWLMAGDLDAHERRLARVASLTSHELRELVRAWMSTPALVIEARGAQPHHSKCRSIHATNSSLSKLRVALSPMPKSSSPARPIALHHASSPTVETHIVIEAGAKEDPAGRSGLAAAALAALTDQSLRRGRATSAEDRERLNATIETRVLRDGCVIRLSSLSADAIASCDLLKDLIHRKFIDDATLARAKARQTAAIQAEKSRLFDLAMRLLPAMVYGPADRAARPPSGIASEIAQVTIEEVATTITRWRLVSGTRIIAVGPQSKEATARLGERLRLDSSRSRKRGAAEVAAPLSAGRVIVVHTPDRKQAAVFASRAIGPRSSDDFAAIAAADTILGGSFSSRLNMKLREDKGWCYGARSVIATWRTAGLWTAYTFVEPKRVIATMKEIEWEWRAMSSVTSSELADTIAFMTRRAAGEAETTAQVAAMAEDLIVADLPRSWHQGLHARFRKLRPNDIAKVCKALANRPLSWVILGDAASLVPAIEKAGFSPVEVIDEPASIR